MRKFLCCLGGVSLAACAVADGAVRISEKFGYDAEDSTRFLQAALDSTDPVIVIDRKESEWVANPLKLVRRANKTIILEDGAFVRAKRGAFKDQCASLFLLDSCTNVTIRGASPKNCGFRMWKRDYWDKTRYKPAQWRHAISLLSCDRITIEGVCGNESGGDGLYISTTGRMGSDPGSGPACTDIVVRNCIFDDNHRQGISVIGADGLLIEDTVMSNTKGTPPESGIDFEPNRPWEPLRNIVMRRCRSFGNAQDGMEVALGCYDRTSSPVSISIEDSEFADNGTSGVYWWGFISDDGAPSNIGGNFRMSRCCITGSAGAGLRLGVKRNGCGRFEFEDVVIANCGRKNRSANDIALCAASHCVGEPDEFVFRNVRCGRDSEGYKVFEFGQDRGCYIGRPCVVRGDISWSVAGRSGSVVLDEKWRSEHMPYVECKRTPPALTPVRASLRDVVIHDSCPGEMVACPCAFLRNVVPTVKNRGGFSCDVGNFLVFHAVKGMAARLTLKQTVVGGGRSFATPGPVEIRSFGADVKSAPIFSAAVPGEPKGGDVSFLAPETGFYSVRIDTGGNGIAVIAANVPVALDLIDQNMGFIAPFGGYGMDHHLAGRNGLFLPVGKDERFEFVFREDGLETFSAEVFDPNGKSEWKRDFVSGFERFQPSAPAVGIWWLEFGRPVKGAYEDHQIGLNGINGWLFLSPEKYWK